MCASGKLLYVAHTVKCLCDDAFSNLLLLLIFCFAVFASKSSEGLWESHNTKVGSVGCRYPYHVSLSGILEFVRNLLKVVFYVKYKNSLRLPFFGFHQRRLQQTATKPENVKHC